MRISTPKTAKTPARKSPKENTFPVVAIGASTGGLEAVTQLLLNLPVDTGMAFIYVQHLSPDHKSILTSLLSKATTMAVKEVTNKILMEPNHFYVVPPDKEMAVIDGHIKLTPRSKDRSANFPIDAFFITLAEKHKKGAIGVVLSGNANDGTAGLKAIKEGGGITFAQDDTAKSSSMPKSAIAAGAVDFVLSPKEIALELAQLSKSNYMQREALQVGKEDEIDDNDPDLRVMLHLLHKETGVDFAHYKMNTIKRRILRRMLLYKIKTLKEYSKLLLKKSEEVNILYQDLLINVTDFFRDSDAYQYLKVTLFPKLLKSKASGETLRIWIPACSTGEEAYSIAMSMLEIQNSTGTNIPVHIFATDLSIQAINKARVGEYSKQELESVSPKRLQSFYTKSGSNYRITKVVRDMCVFAPHNILSDPPFSRVDFISCCNLLIYLDTAAQKKVFATFHYALNDGGYLMLGKAESIGTSSNLFKHINNKFKIYSRKKRTGARKLPDLLLRTQHVLAKDVRTALNEKGNTTRPLKQIIAPKNQLGSIVDSILLTQYMPASVVINLDLDILEFRGATDLYLSHSSGRASLNILKTTRPEIAFELRTAIQKAIKTKLEVRKEGIEMKIDTTTHIVSVSIIPLGIEGEEPMLLILFSEQHQVEPYWNQSDGKKNGSIAKDRRIKKLQEELAAAQADMLSFSQEQEAFNQELQSANEEVVSSNEELQSVNEELETSKEEIESANEELITTNQELQTRNELLSESYNYSEAITATIHEPMIILHKNLFVKSANESFYRKFGVNAEETEGVLLYDLGNKQWDIPRLRDLLENIIPKNAYFRDFEVTHTFPGIGERIMLLNANRIEQKNHNEQLILLAIDDITERALLNLEEKAFFKKDTHERKIINIKLEKIVRDRTQQLLEANETLAENVNELEKKNNVLREFAYVSSHDLQEPLRKIQTFTSRIFEKDHDNLSVEGRDHFSRIQVSIVRMRQLIENLLSFSSINTAERKFENTSIKLVIAEVVAEVKESIEEKKANVEVIGDCTVHIVHFQFRQLMHNLLSNALKFHNPYVTPHITISCRTALGNKLGNHKLAPTKKYCHIRFHDNGIGFEPQFSERIFEVFQKLHSKDKYAGTGIGLAIVKKIVENHNGFITVASEVNVGTTFDIYIPVTKKKVPVASA